MDGTTIKARKGARTRDTRFRSSLSPVYMPFHNSYWRIFTSPTSKRRAALKKKKLCWNGTAICPFFLSVDATGRRCELCNTTGTTHGLE
jgi:hypothetical protein